MRIDIVEGLLIPITQIFIYIFGFSSIYLLIKYRSLAFWEKATKKEMLFPTVGFLGGVVVGLISIVFAVVFGD